MLTCAPVCSLFLSPNYLRFICCPLPLPPPSPQRKGTESGLSKTPGDSGDSSLSTQILTAFCSPFSITQWNLSPPWFLFFNVMDHLAKCWGQLNKFAVCYIIELNWWVRSFRNIAVVEERQAVGVQICAVWHFSHWMPVAIKFVYSY